MQYFKSLTQSGLISLIASTKNCLFICLPSIHEEVYEALVKLSSTSALTNETIKIHIVIDYDAQTFRQGYGDHQSVEKLLQSDFEIRSLKNNRISFIISDEIGYYLFIESRSLIPADKETINAIKIDPVSQVRLKKFFFSSSETIDYEDDLTNAIIEESKQLGMARELISDQVAPVSTIKKEDLKMVSEDLKANPPLKPDFKRIVDFYSNKFQYVTLSFEGSGIQHRKIELPAKALPIPDAKLKEKLETKLNLFDQDEAENTFRALNQLKDEVKALREKYLTKIKSRDESLLDKLKKSAFEKEKLLLESKIKDVKAQTLIAISEQINQTKKSILIDLTDFLVENPKALFPKNPDLWEGNKEYIIQTAKSKAEEIIYRIRWPEAHTLVDEFKLNDKYSEITYEDLKNIEFVIELKECGLISSADETELANFSKGIGIN